MAKYQAYAEYKDSGLEWLGEIPSHWKVKKLKYLGEAIIGLTYSPDDVVDESEGTLVLRSSNIQNKKLAFEDNVYVRKEIPEKLRTQKNDILICARNGSRALIGKNALIDESAEGVSFGAFMSIFRSEYNSYLSKVFNSALFEYQSGTFLTATINQLTTGNLNSFEVPLPPLTERNQISNFLDHETRKIDHLIEKQQQLIELLKEKRQAVISHAVTKGLDPNVQMKDSGVEWLGEVPEHWDTTKIKYVAELTPKKSEVSSNDNRLCTFVPMEKLKLGSLIKDEEKPISEVIGGYTYFKNGDLLLAKVTPCFENKNMVVASDLKNGIGFGSSEIYVLRANHKVNTQFLYYRLQEDQFMELGTGAMTGAGGLKRVPSEFLNNFQFALPPLSEQIAITKYLNQYLIKNEYLMNKAQSAIQLMQERRTALISAAVTGKIDVRHWQAPNVTEADTELSA